MWPKLCARSLVLSACLATWTLDLIAQERLPTSSANLPLISQVNSKSLNENDDSEKGQSQNHELVEATLTAKAIIQLMQDQPLSEKTWPIWRDYYERLFFAYEVGEPLEFYAQLHRFVGGIAAQNGGILRGKLAEDAVAWVILSKQLERWSPPLTEQAEAASRQALSFDKSGMSAFSLATCLIDAVGLQAKAGQLTSDERLQLSEAEELLQRVEQLAPQSRLSFYRGLAQWYRGDQDTALNLLRQGALDHRDQSSYAGIYLSLLSSSKQAKKPYADATAPFLKQFPNDPAIQAHHIMALHGDERFSEAYETLQTLRQGTLIEELLGPDLIKAVEEGRWLIPPVLNGLKLRESGSHAEAIQEFRRAISKDSDNPLAARLLANSLIDRADGDRTRDSSKLLGEAVDECSNLSQLFPDDPALHVAYAAALFRAHRNIEADEELSRAKLLAGDLHEFVEPLLETEIHQAAQRDKSIRNVFRGIVALMVASVSWISLMFVLGAVLAVCTSRLPNACNGSVIARTAGEVWLERGYLFVLSLSLVFFYVSVPFVAIGLLAITAVLFGLMLVLRVIHFGILYRGLFAVWGVIRSAFIGPSYDCVSVVANREQHPQLNEVLREVAGRLDTSPADVIYLTPSSLIGVREQGKGPFGLFKRCRVLEIGISTLSQLTTSEFKSILAHEFGHFSHQDTFFARVFSQVTASLANSMTVMNAAGGEANYINPFYWFYWLYLRAYTLLASGFSRSREFLADRRAVVAYGKSPFISALTKVSVDGAAFESSAVLNIKAALESGKRFVNVFDAFRQYRDQPELAGAQQQLFERIRGTKPSWFDSHPTYSERLAALHEFPESREQVETLPATSLLSDFEQIEELLTELLTEHVHAACDIV